MSASGDQDFIARARGRTPLQIIIGGLGGFLLALASVAIHGMQTVVGFLLLPFEIFTTIARASAEGFFVQPLQLIPAGVRVSAQSLAQQSGLVGILGLPLATSMVLVSYFLVIGFIAFEITSNFLPGLIVDNPIWDRLFGTPEEEFDDED